MSGTTMNHLAVSDRLRAAAFGTLYIAGTGRYDVIRLVGSGERRMPGPTVFAVPFDPAAPGAANLAESVAAAFLAGLETARADAQESARRAFKSAKARVYACPATDPQYQGLVDALNRAQGALEAAGVDPSSVSL